ncbi:hypothetical protein [uncultured Kordia sp.]|uniref:hypothetical protein n=1 Tax=uncultured Kordia sp. TaxID=507699 RepID=UPI002627910E|nr:hypothetical protein [uncultured Kordia sp.]
MKNITAKYIEFITNDRKELANDETFVKINSNLFEVIYNFLKENKIKEILKGKNEYSTYQYKYAGNMAVNPYGTNLFEIFTIFHFLIKEKFLTRREVTESLLSIAFENYTYIFIYMHYYLSKIGTEFDTVLDWHSLVDYINRSYLDKNIPIEDTSFFNNNEMERFNEKNLGIKFNI